jgi:hypothetical protein
MVDFLPDLSSERTGMSLHRKSALNGARLVDAACRTSVEFRELRASDGRILFDRCILFDCRILVFVSQTLVLPPLSGARMTHILRTLAALSLASLLLTGCHVSEHRQGDNKNVDIGTPFGSLQVKTSDKGDTSALGFAPYPGAVPVRKDGDKDSNSADIHMSFGNFHLGVKAASFQTPDSQEKVLAFYRKDLASRYGVVIECRGDNPVGSPSRTSEGLTCDATKHNHMNTRVISDDNLELRAGSDQHQHIVGVEDHDGGTKIGLVSLDLPSQLIVGMSDHKSGRKDSE